MQLEPQEGMWDLGGYFARQAQLSRDVTVSPVNFEGVIITGKYCTNYDSNTGIFSGAHLL